MKTIRYYHPIKKKWELWKSCISGIMKFKTGKEALKIFENQQSVRNGVIERYEVVNTK